MSKNLKRIIRLNDLVSLALRKKHTLVLNPQGRKDREDLDEDIVYDKREWNIPEEYSQYIEELSKDETLSTEDKILKIYEKIGTDYVYDDNLISYIKKIDDDTYAIPDWYARDADDDWENNRKEHKRRICFELARYLAKSLMELLKDNNDYSICIHWNKELTHYFVGLTCSEYSVTLDPDDFFNIKDLTRLKTKLTAQGINILEDKQKKFNNALKKFNEGRSEYAIKKMEYEINGEDIFFHSDTQKQNNSETDKNDNILFLRKVMHILVKEYNLDSQGIFEYIKEIVDIKLGPDKREKVWKEIKGKTKESTRYIRCLIVNVDNKKFLIDGDEKIIRLFDEKEFNNKRAIFIPYKDLQRGGFDYYDGT